MSAAIEEERWQPDLKMGDGGLPETATPHLREGGAKKYEQELHDALTYLGKAMMT